MTDSNVEYGQFECDDCPCIFVTKVDLDSHVESGQHDRFGDRFAEMNNRKFKYTSRRRRLKEDLYEQQNNETQDRLK